METACRCRNAAGYQHVDMFLPVDLLGKTQVCIEHLRDEYRDGTPEKQVAQRREQL